MADAPEQPGSIQAGASAPGAFSEHAPPIVPFLAPSGGDERELAYRPLSLLAIAGFSLAVVYAVAVTLGGLFVFASRRPLLFKLLLVMAPVAAVLVAAMRRVREPARIAAFAGMVLAGLATVISLLSLVAYSSSNPWLLPDLTWLLVIAAAGVSWVAANRIQASEETLSGAELARWGLYLSLFFGINYGAYWAATKWAVRGQARKAADDFLAKLKQGDTVAAFLETVPPVRRPPEGISGTALRELIEVEFNAQRSGQQGDYSAFCQSRLTRLLQNYGQEATIELGNMTPDFQQGAHRVHFRYKIDTPRGAFDASVTTIGVDDKDTGRRLWFIDLRGTSLLEPIGDDSRAAEMDDLTRAARAFAGDWHEKLRAGALAEAYLSTVDVAQRDQQRKAAILSLPGLTALSGVGPMAQPMSGAGGEAFRKGFEAFRKGTILDLEGGGKPTERFWASKVGSKEDGKTVPLREKMLSRVHEIFTGAAVGRFTIDLPAVPIPITKQVGDKLHLSLTARLMFAKPTNEPDFQIEALTIVELPASKEKVKSDAMRIRSLQLLRGATASMPADSRQQRRR